MCRRGLSVEQGAERSTRGTNQHFIPAAYLGRFSVEAEGRARKRTVWARNTQAPNSFPSRAENLASQIGLYDVEDASMGQGRTADIAWAYESGLPGALDQLADAGAPLDGEVWTTVLVPFVAGLFVRGPNFQQLFQARFPENFDAAVLKSREDNATAARLIELQELLAPVMTAHWTVLHFSKSVDLVTSDTGWAAATTPVGDSYVVPLDCHTALALTPAIRRLILGRTDASWKAEVNHVQVNNHEATRLRRAIGAFAWHAVYGPTKESVDDAAQELGNAPRIGPSLFGAAVDIEHECHLYDYFRVMSAIASPLDETQTAADNINWTAVRDRWTAPIVVEVLFPERTSGGVRVDNCITVDLTPGLQLRSARRASGDFMTGAKSLIELDLLEPTTGHLGPRNT